MISKNRIYPVFLPHAGCPFQCVYCNQHAVTTSLLGQTPQPEDLPSFFDSVFNPLRDQALASGVSGEIAFYGGTFTALPKATLKELLERVSPWVKEGVFTGIRFSTRPDGITHEVCALLGNYPVRTVELGVQSLSDEVLQRSRRGYRVAAVEQAAALVRSQGWQLGIQLMLGLPGDSRERFLASVQKAIELRPDLMRLYPTLVLEGTVLADWYLAGNFRPLTLDEAVAWCASAYDDLLHAAVPAARMGLHADPELEKPGRILSGPYHPAFGYLVRVRWWRDRVDRVLDAEGGLKNGDMLLVSAPNAQLSEVIGPKRNNLRHWQEKYGLDRVEVQGSVSVPPNHFQCRWVKREANYSHLR